MVVKNAIRVGMPVWERGGDVTQLGGEFVLGPGYASRYPTLPSCAHIHPGRSVHMPTACARHAHTRPYNTFSLS